MRKEYISKEAWSKILIFFKQCKGIYLGKIENFKNFIEAIFWLTRTGSQWREIPSKYGKWNSIFSRFNEWSKKEIWNQFFEFCIVDPDLEYVMMDATIVRSHASAAGYKKNQSEALGRSCGGFTSKIHALVDALGNPLKIILTSGNTHDSTQARALLGNISKAYVLADKGYSSIKFIQTLKNQNCIPVIPPKSNLKEPWKYDKHIYKERHLVECFFSKIKYYRRLSSRFDKSARNYLSFLLFIGALIWLR